MEITHIAEPVAKPGPRLRGERDLGDSTTALRSADAAAQALNDSVLPLLVSPTRRNRPPGRSRRRSRRASSRSREAFGARLFGKRRVPAAAERGGVFGRRHERQRPGGGRSVGLGDPEREVDERRGHVPERFAHGHRLDLSGACSVNPRPPRRRSA
jgi:hypothetical protein